VASSREEDISAAESEPNEPKRRVAWTQSCSLMPWLLLRARVFAKAVSRAVERSSPKGENPTVIRASEPFRPQDLGCFEDAVADLFRHFHPRVDRIDDADEDPGSRRSDRRNFNIRGGSALGGPGSGKGFSGRNIKFFPGEASGSLLLPVRRARPSLPKAPCNVRRCPWDNSRGFQGFRRGLCINSRAGESFRRGSCSRSKPLQLLQSDRELLQRGWRMRIRPSCVAWRGYCVGSGGLLVLQSGRRRAVERL
jgi:hypothetical protein